MLRLRLVQPRIRALTTIPSKPLLDIYLPDISQPDPEPPIQVPYLPDFWDSKPLTKQHHVSDPPLPKLVIIAGADTHHGGGPSHNLHDEHREMGRLIDLHVVPPLASTNANNANASTSQTTLLQDIANDIGLPPSLKDLNVRNAVKEFFLARSAQIYKGQSRDLDKDEMRGVWLLLGILAGSWIAGGVLNRAPPPSTDSHNLE